MIGVLDAFLETLPLEFGQEELPILEFESSPACSGNNSDTNPAIKKAKDENEIRRERWTFSMNKVFLDVPHAAYRVGYSERHFRRKVEEDRIPIMEINGRFFLLVRDLEAWQSTQHSTT